MSIVPLWNILPYGDCDCNSYKKILPFPMQKNFLFLQNYQKIARTENLSFSEKSKKDFKNGAGNFDKRSKIWYDILAY